MTRVVFETLGRSINVMVVLASSINGKFCPLFRWNAFAQLSNPFPNWLPIGRCGRRLRKHGLLCSLFVFPHQICNHIGGRSKPATR